jgi:hypothetical protein
MRFQQVLLTRCWRTTKFTILAVVVAVNRRRQVQIFVPEWTVHCVTSHRRMVILVTVPDTNVNHCEGLYCI